MNITETRAALGVIAAELARTNEHRRAVGAPPLESVDWEWTQRSIELWNRISAVIHAAWESPEPPAPELVAEVGAHATAFLIAVYRAQETRVETGDS